MGLRKRSSRLNTGAVWIRDFLLYSAKCGIVSRVLVLICRHMVRSMAWLVLREVCALWVLSTLWFI